MAWYDEAVFYHIYPLGMTGAPMNNSYDAPVNRLEKLHPFLQHIANLGCNAIYIGPLFESVGHGYETTDYKKLDSRLGTNEDLKIFVKKCHDLGIRVIFDGVFNHTGRDFFAFKDIQQNRENSPYKDWYCNVNFYGNNEYNDGFSYDNWGGYNLLVKLNQRNPAVRDYIHDVIRFWVSEFDVDGIRLDAADVLDFDFMKSLRWLADQVKPEFWLMGEVIHGDYTRWVNENTLHCVTNYVLHKALYSGHNDHNFFEIAHTVKRLYGMGGNQPNGLKLYNFVDNHDVERIFTKLTNKAQFTPVHILLYTLPGIPSIYYGSEFGIEGRKEKGSDASLRPELSYENYKDALQTNPYTRLISKLGKIRQAVPALSYGDYRELVLTNRQYAYSRNCGDQKVIVVTNNDENGANITVGADNVASYTGLLTGNVYQANNGCINVQLSPNSGDILVPTNQVPDLDGLATTPIVTTCCDTSAKETPAEPIAAPASSETPSATKEEPTISSEVNEISSVEEQTISAEITAPTVEAGNADAPKEEAVATPSTETVPPVSVPNTELENAKKQAYDEGVIAGLQEAILAIMSKNGPITDQMRRDVENNVYHDSLINWVKSFR